MLKKSIERSIYAYGYRCEFVNPEALTAVWILNERERRGYSFCLTVGPERWAELLVGEGWDRLIPNPTIPHFVLVDGIAIKLNRELGSAMYMLIHRDIDDGKEKE